MEKSHLNGTAARPKKPAEPLRTKLMFAASAGIIALVVPGGLYGTRASAQSLLPECSDDPTLAPGINNGNFEADDGETIECDADPGPIGAISTSAEDLTINVTENTQVIGTGGRIFAIEMHGDGDKTLNLRANSLVQNNTDTSAVNIESDDGKISIENLGTLQAYQAPDSAGGETLVAVEAAVIGGSGELKIDSSNGVIRGRTYAYQGGSGNTYLDIGEASSQSSDATIEIYAGDTAGQVYVTTTGTVTNTPSSDLASGAPSFVGDAIKVENNGSGVTGIDTRQAVTGSANGIVVDHSSAGNISMVTQAVTGQNGVGIYVNNTSKTNSSTYVTTYRAVTGSTDGIVLNQTGNPGSIRAGALTLNSSRLVTGSAGDGVRATNSIRNGSTYLTLRGGANGGENGVLANNQAGTKNLLMTTSGSVSGTNLRGIDATNDGTGYTKIILAGAVTGGTDGVVVEHLGAEDLTLTTQAVTGNNGHGIEALNNSTTGAHTHITTNGVVTGTGGASGTGRGIQARGGVSAGDINVTTNARVEGIFGLYTTNGSMGDSANGVFPGNINLNVNDEIYGSSTGVFSRHDGTGDSTLTIGNNGNIAGFRTGVAMGGGANILVQGTTDTNDTSGAISGGVVGMGIVGNNSSITVQDLTSVAGGTANGLNALSRGGAITITNIDRLSSQGTVTGDKTANFALNADSRTDWDDNASAGGDVSIQDISIGEFTDVNGDTVRSSAGILAYSGTGTLNIGAADPDAGSGIGDITTEGLGIYGNSHGSRVDVHIDGTVTTGATGLLLRNHGTGTMTIETEAVSSANATAIDAVNDGGLVGNLMVTTNGMITAGTNGINATTSYGNITINAVGGVTAAGTGIKTNSLGDDTIYVNDVSAGTGAALDIVADTSNVTVNGAVSSNGFHAIQIDTYSGATVTITETGSVAANGPNAAINFVERYSPVVNDVLTLEGAVLADVLMGTGDDTLNFGGTIGSDTEDATIYGGDGTDTVNFTDANTLALAQTLTNSGAAGDDIYEFEVFNFDGDNFILAGDHVGLQEANFNTGTTILEEGASLEAGSGVIAMDAILNARNNSEFIGNLINNGTLNIGSSPGRFDITGNFEQSATGTLPIEFEGEDFDQLFVSGTAILGGTLSVSVLNNLLPTEMREYTIIDAQDGITGAFSNIVDTIPDLDFAETYTGSAVNLTFVSTVPVSPPSPPPPPADTGDDPDTGTDDDPDTGTDDDTDTGTGGDDPDTGTGDDPDTGTGDDPDPDPDPDTTADPDPDTNTDPDPDQTDPDEPDLSTDTPVEPLLSPKEIVPSGLMSGMAASDLFASSLIQRRSDYMAPGEWSFWSAGMGGQYDVGNKDGLSGWDGGTSGFMFGLEHLIDQQGVPILLGFSTGWSKSDLDSGPSHGEVDSVHIGFFANAEFNAFFFGAAASHAWQDYDFQRVFVMDSGPVIAVSETEGKASTFKSEAYYDLLWTRNADPSAPGFGFGPIFTADYSTGTFNRFKESGAGILNLTYEGESAGQAVLGAGASGSYSAALFGTTLVDTGFRILWENVSGDKAINSHASLIVPGALFSPSSVTLDENRVAAGADAKVYFSDSVFAHIRYDTTRSDNFTEHEGWAGITFRF